MSEYINATIEFEVEATIESLQRHLKKLRDARSGERPSDANNDVGIETRFIVETARTMTVYWLGCRGLADLSASLPGTPPVARIGCSTERNIEVRLRAAAADAYGSWSRDQKGELRESPGFTRWVMQTISTTRPSLDPAAVARTRTLEISLPEGMTRRGFDRALHVALSPWSLASRYPEQTRYTCYSMGADRISRAIELYAGLDPRHDGDRLLGIVESILQTHREKSETIANAPLDPVRPREIAARRDGEKRSRAPMSALQVAAMQARLRYGTRRS